MKTIILTLLQLAAFTATAQNYALTLNGINQTVSIGSPMTSGASYTKEAWVYATASSNNHNIISSNAAPLWINAGILYAGQGNSYTLVADVSPFPLNQWVHVAITYNVATTTLRLYRNGTLVATNTSAPAYTSEPTYIGSHTGGQSYFQGRVDELRIWNIARTQEQIKATMYNAPVSTPNLVAYYSCNDGSGNTLSDAKASYNGNITNAAGFVASPIQHSASAISFDGLDDIVTIPDNNSLDISSAITLEAWIYPIKNSGIQNVMSKSSSASNNGYIFPRTDNGWASFSTYLHIGGAFRVVSSPLPSLNTWYHLAATYDGSAIRIYLNGALVNSLPVTGTISTNGNNLILGNQPGFSEYFGGVADEFRIWNIARSQTEIQNNMNKQLDPATNTGLVSYYKVNQGGVGATNTGLVTLVDQKSSNNGTMSGFAWTGSTSNFVGQNAFITLPVQWQSFSAFKQNQGAILEWSTASEQNTKNFIIQRSPDARIWKDLATVAAAGNSSAVTSYSYEDVQPQAGVNYYRIQQTDIDGRLSYSDVKFVQFSNQASGWFTLQTNPVLDKTIHLQVRTPATFSIYTASGKLVKQQQAAAGKVKIDMNAFAAGIYFIKTGSQTEKVMIK
jgi:hypothetical protein